MFKPLRSLLHYLVRRGDLTIYDSRGIAHRFGDRTGEPVVARFTDSRLEWRLFADPQLALGEAFMDGRLVMERGRIYDFLAVVLADSDTLGLPAWSRSIDAVRYLTRHVAQFNPTGRARANVKHHYDITGAIYDLFLDKDRQYSCAYFTPGADLETAQSAKMRHIAAKLRLESGMRVLDIGSGWGGLGLYLAQSFDADVTGVTLSVEQLRIARERASKAGIEASLRFMMEDYRVHRGRYDRVVSVGMFEHVGVSHYRTYFKRVSELLTDDGVALIHTIGRSEPPTATNAFIRRHIFPGGYIPALSEVLAATERARLIATDVEVLRLHYAETLKAWRERFLARRDEAVQLMDERFCRMWEFYLAASEAAFRYQNLVVFQIQLAKRIDTLPIIRDYMIDDERRIAARERRSRDGEQRPRLAG